MLAPTGKTMNRRLCREVLSRQQWKSVMNVCVTVTECEARLCCKRTLHSANTFLWQTTSKLRAEVAVQRKVKAGETVLEFSRYVVQFGVHASYKGAAPLLIMAPTQMVTAIQGFVEDHNRSFGYKRKLYFSLSKNLNSCFYH